MTAPATDEATEDKRGEDRKYKKDEPGINRAVLERVHRFRRLDRRNGLTCEPPLNNVRDHQEIQDNQRHRPPKGRS